MTTFHAELWCKGLGHSKRKGLVVNIASPSTPSSSSSLALEGSSPTSPQLGPSSPNTSTRADVFHPVSPADDDSEEEDEYGQDSDHLKTSPFKKKFLSSSKRHSKPPKNQSHCPALEHVNTDIPAMVRSGDCSSSSSSSSSASPIDPAGLLLSKKPSKSRLGRLAIRDFLHRSSSPTSTSLSPTSSSSTATVDDIGALSLSDSSSSTTITQTETCPVLSSSGTPLRMRGSSTTSNDTITPPTVLSRPPQKTSKRNVFEMLASKKSAFSLKAPSSVGSTTTATSSKANSTQLKEPGAFLKDKYGSCESTIIGRGATACVRTIVVCKKNTPCDGKVLAVKEFRKKRKDESEREYIKRMTSEFCISSSLHHPNVVETLDLVVDEHHNWCEVMEYMRGGSLYSVLRDRKLTPEDANCCFKQLMKGVEYLHSMGVAHRDLKPENLLFDEHGHLKITDFGVSDVFKTVFDPSPHLSRGVCGSEPYIAPEEFNVSEYDAREVDIWAAGVIYYVMVYSGLPWKHATKGDSNYAYYVAHRRGGFTPIDKLPEDVAELMYSILDPDPKRRMTARQITESHWIQGIHVCNDLKDCEGKEHHHVSC